MRRLIITIITLFTLFAAGCTQKKSAAERIQEKLGIEGIEKITGSLSGGWVVTLKVRNETNYNPILKTGEGDLYCDNIHTAHVSLMAPVTLPKRSISSVDVPLEIKIHNPLRAIALLTKLSDKNFSGVEIAFDSDIEVMGISKHFGSPRVAATKLFQNFGL